MFYSHRHRPRHWAALDFKYCVAQPLVASLAVLILASVTTAQLRVVTYNTANSGDDASPVNPRDGMSTVLQAIGDEIVGGIFRPIDVLALQEQATFQTTTAAIADLLNELYGDEIYAVAPVNGFSNGGGRPGLIYNANTVGYHGAVSFGRVSSSTAARQTVRYRLRPVGYDSTADLWIYNAHYKAGSTGTDQNRREEQAIDIRNNADLLGSGANVVYLGDYNIRSSDEDMYQVLLGAGNGQAHDPIDEPGDWHNDSRYVDLHTQSPADGGDSSLVTGGMDDRFDFQLVTDELLDDEGLSVIPGSYHAFGNNGSHPLNAAINHANNTAQPGFVLDALADVSDHLPVVVDYQIPAKMSIQLVKQDRVIVGSSPSIVALITNSANSAFAAGADELDYTIIGSGAVSGEMSGTVQAASIGDVRQLALVDGQAGAKSGMVQVTSNSQAVADGDYSESISYDVLDHANGSFSSSQDVNDLQFDFGIVPMGSGILSQSFELFNIESTMGFTAALDLDEVETSGDTSVLGTDLAPVGDLAAGDSTSFNLHFDTSTSGSFSTTIDLSLSDENLPGASELDPLTIQVLGTAALPGDANLDGLVNLLDYQIWHSNRFLVDRDWSTADFDGDGDTDVRDLNLWNKHKRLVESPTTTVPEPWSWTGMISLAMTIARKQRQLRSRLTAQRR